MGGLLAARSDPAVLLVSGGRGAALLDRQPAGEGRHVRQHVWRTLWRSLLLVALGIFLRSMYGPLTNFTFRRHAHADRTWAIPFLFLLGFRKPRWQWVALAVVLAGYWLAWALYPAAGPGFNWQTVGVPPNWPHYFSGFAAHWNKNANLGNAFDQWFLNLFPRAQPFVFNDGGYLTLSFIPTLGTMILGTGGRVAGCARSAPADSHASVWLSPARRV